MNGLRAIVLAALVSVVTVPAWTRVGTLVQQAPPRVQTLRNPFEGQASAERAGAKLFARECAACHGRDGRGMEKAPPLDGSDVRTASPGALFWVLRNGSLKRGMPSFAHLPEAQRWQIIGYLKTLKAR